MDKRDTSVGSQVFGVPLDVSVPGSGTIKSIGGEAITNFSCCNLEWFFDFIGSVDVIVTQGFHGSGPYQHLIGASEVVAFPGKTNSILHNWRSKFHLIGLVVVFSSLQTAVESCYEWVGSGTLFGFNNTEESSMRRI